MASFLKKYYALYMNLFTRPLQNAPFCPIPASGSNFNPQNTQCIPACPVGPADRTGVVKIIAFFGLEQNWTFFKGLALSNHT